MDRSRPFQLYCYAYRDMFCATLEHEQQGGTFRPRTFLSPVSLPNERNWIILELGVKAIIRATKRLRVHLFFIPFIFVSDQALQHLDKVGERHR